MTALATPILLLSLPELRNFSTEKAVVSDTFSRKSANLHATATSSVLPTRDVIQDFGGLAFRAQLVLCSSPLKDSGKSIISNLQSSSRHQCVTGMAEPDAFLEKVARVRLSVDEAMEIILVDKPIASQILLDMAHERFGIFLGFGILARNERDRALEAKNALTAKQ